MNIILTNPKHGTAPLDAEHQYITVGPNAWGIGATPQAAERNCRSNLRRGYRGPLFTRVTPKAGFRIDGVDGAVFWSHEHDVHACPQCSVARVSIHTEKTWPKA